LSKPRSVSRGFVLNGRKNRNQESQTGIKTESPGTLFWGTGAPGLSCSCNAGDLLVSPAANLRRFEIIPAVQWCGGEGDHAFDACSPVASH
jgi:hypothetical protein